MKQWQMCEPPSLLLPKEKQLWEGSFLEWRSSQGGLLDSSQSCRVERYHEDHLVQAVTKQESFCPAWLRLSLLLCQLSYVETFLHWSFFYSRLYLSPSLISPWASKMHIWKGKNKFGNLQNRRGIWSGVINTFLTHHLSTPNPPPTLQVSKFLLLTGCLMIC